MPLRMPRGIDDQGRAERDPKGSPRQQTAGLYNEFALQPIIKAQARLLNPMWAWTVTALVSFRIQSTFLMLYQPSCLEAVVYFTPRPSLPFSCFPIRPVSVCSTHNRSPFCHSQPLGPISQPVSQFRHSQPTRKVGAHSRDPISPKL